jgi:hypothetical protein
MRCKFGFRNETVDAEMSKHVGENNECVGRSGNVTQTHTQENAI